MLVIGDLNSKNLIYDTYEVFNREFICINSNEIRNYVDKFKLRKKNIIFSNNYSVTYKQNNKLYTFHDSSIYLILENISRISANNMYKVRYASKISEWAICKSRLKFIHDDVNSWCNRIETYLNINDNINVNNLNTLNLFKSYSTNLSSWIINTYGIQKSIYKPRVFDTYNKRDLYNIVTKDSEPQYLKVLLNTIDNSKPDTIGDYLFNRLDYKQKVKAVVENIYVNMINDYIIPELEIYNRLLPKKDLFELYMTTYMKICSQYISHSFTNFAIHNYYNIIDGFNENIITKVFNNAIKNKLIEKI